MHVGIFHFSSLASLMFPLTFFTEKSATKIMMRSNSNNSITGCSLSERFILLSIKPNYDNRFFLDLLKFTQTTVLKSGIQTWNLNPKFQNNVCKSIDMLTFYNYGKLGVLPLWKSNFSQKVTVNKHQISPS